MKKIIYFLSVCLLATSVIFLGGCERKEKKLTIEYVYPPNPPTQPDSIPTGAVIVFMRNGNLHTDRNYIYPKNCDLPFFINKSDNFQGESNTANDGWKFAVIGEVEGLWKITEKPADNSTAWATEVAVKPGYGYVGQCDNENSNVRAYVAIYVARLVKDADTGGIIGAEVRYYSPFPTANR